MRYFEYEKALSLKEAFDAVAGSRGDTVFMAGGTDLLTKIKSGQIKPRRVVDVKGIDEICGLSVQKDMLSVGSLTTIRLLETSSVVHGKIPLLAQAASRLGSVQVRHRATIGGNLCNAAPSAETAPALLSLDAQAEIYGKSGTRSVDLRDFFLGPGSTVLKEGEVLARLNIPFKEENEGSVYYNLTTRKAMDIAIVGVAVRLVLDEGHRIKKARIALGAVAPTPVRVPQSEEVLEGELLSEELAMKSAEIAARICQPISDLRASADYRREMVKNLCYRGLFATYADARKQ